MDKKKLEGLVKLVGNQRIEDDFPSIKKADGDTINLTNLAKALNTSVDKCSSSSSRFILLELAKIEPEGWGGTSYFFDKGNSGVTVHLYEPCHRGLSGCTETTTFLAQFYPDNDSLPYVLSMFADDGPFKSVVQDVSFVPVEKGVFAVFRNAKLSAKIFTNFLIWTRSFYQHRSDKVLSILEGYGLTRKESIALAPVFLGRYITNSNRFSMLLNSFYGDIPVYLYMGHRAYRGGYHPNDYLNSNVATKSYDYKATIGVVNPNPCNLYLSRRDKDYFTYVGKYAGREFDTFKGGRSGALKELYSAIRYSLENDCTVDEAVAKIGA